LKEVLWMHRIAPTILKNRKLCRFISKDTTSPVTLSVLSFRRVVDGRFVHKADIGSFLLLPSYHLPATDAEGNHIKKQSYRSAKIKPSNNGPIHTSGAKTLWER